MSQLEVNKPTDSFSQCWRRWTEIVAMYATRHRACGRLDPQHYQKLHRELRSACLAPTVGEADRRVHEAIEILTRPWLSLSVLENTDHEILCSVLGRCRQVDRELHGADRTRFAPKRHGRLFAASALLALLAIAAAFTGLRKPVRSGLNDIRESIMRIDWEVSPIQVIIASGVVAAVVCVWLVARTART